MVFFKCGQQFCVLAGAVVSCFGEDNSFLFWQEQWFHFLAEVAVVLCFGGGGSFVFLQGEFCDLAGRAFLCLGRGSGFGFGRGASGFAFWRGWQFHILSRGVLGLKM